MGLPPGTVQVDEADGQAPDRPGTARVLFVDDDPQTLAELARDLRRQQPDWAAAYVATAGQALDLLAGGGVDIVVSAVRMQCPDGLPLLSVLRARHPGVARLVLSDHADRDLVIRAAGPAQQFLSKPIRTELLVTAVDRVLQLRDLIGDQRIRESLGGMSALPKPPELYRRLTEVTADPDHDLDDVAEVISADLTASAEVLRLVNSSFFGLGGRVDSVARAVTLLGLPTVRALLVAGGVFGRGPVLPDGLDAAALSRDGLAVAALSRTIARAEDWPGEAVADMFSAGLLHRIGLPVLACAQPERWAAIRRLPAANLWTDHDVSTRHFGCSPSRASAYLLGLWGFAEPVVHAVADQPAGPDASPAAQLLTYARHVAAGPSLPFPPADGYLDGDRLARWSGVVRDVSLD
ncbi:MAG TPA: response regulator [Kineosporiaceae bacterium]|nr:response regulator [Kineosporiaceae bacterium]